MKQKMIYISDELHSWLKDEPNVSNLIERLLRENYFNKKKKGLYDDLKVEQLEKLYELEVAKEILAKQKEEKLKELKQQEEEIENKAKEVLQNE